MRLQYICKFIFNEQLGLTHSLTRDLPGFREHSGAKINYSDLNIEHAFNLRNHPLLFENDIKQQSIDCFTNNNYKAFFKTTDSDFSFDFFAAAFYLLSRYEEYFPHEVDIYGRYAHENSIAFRENFLNVPLINTWILDFAKTLKNKFPDLKFEYPSFNFQPTYDIDIAYSFKHKGFLRNVGGFIKNPSIERLSVLSRIKKDPFDSYDFLDSIHKKYSLQPIYFFLVGKNGKLDKNIPFESKEMQILFENIKSKYKVGLHPSFQSNFDIYLLKEEAAKINTGKSRQHYIYFKLPDTYQNLISLGITEDYSMGYGSINGFRASTSFPFYWFDLSKNKKTSLKLFSFCYMECIRFLNRVTT